MTEATVPDALFVCAVTCFSPLHQSGMIRAKQETARVVFPRSEVERQRRTGTERHANSVRPCALARSVGPVWAAFLVLKVL